MEKEFTESQKEIIKKEKLTPHQQELLKQCRWYGRHEMNGGGYKFYFYMIERKWVEHDGVFYLTEFYPKRNMDGFLKKYDAIPYTLELNLFVALSEKELLGYFNGVEEEKNLFYKKVIPEYLS